MLLVYGERFSYADAARVVDAPSETIARRAGRALANYAEHLSGLTSATAPDASVETLHPSSEPNDD
jgi:DNA-directed RNA polymerase specialized sigma24 family protein